MDVYANHLHLDPLDRAAGRKAIEKPIERFNADHPDDPPMVIEPGLVEVVLDQVAEGHLVLRRAPTDSAGGNGEIAQQEIATPYLQLVMMRLWDRERSNGSRILRLATLEEELGGAQVIVGSHVDHALNTLTDAQRDVAADLFRYLVTPSGMKIALTIADLAQYSEYPESEVINVSARLSDQRILRAVDPAPGQADARFEIFHDVLAPAMLEWQRSQREARLESERRAAEEDALAQRWRTRRLITIAAGEFICLIALVAFMLVLVATR